MTTGNIDEADDGGRTALMYSAIADQLECLQLLLNCGATVGLQDTTGQTALHWAAATVRLALKMVYFTCSCVFSVVVLFFGVF